MEYVLTFSLIFLNKVGRFRWKLFHSKVLGVSHDLYLYCILFFLNEAFKLIHKAIHYLQRLFFERSKR